MQLFQQSYWKRSTNDLIITRLNAYGSSLDSSRTTYGKQSISLNTSYSSWEEILFSVSQSSILFNVFTSDLFSILSDTEFASCTDDNTPYITGRNAKEVTWSLEFLSDKLMEWFLNNKMKVTQDILHLLTSSKDGLNICINDDVISSTKCEKVQGVMIDTKLNFNSYNVNDMRKNACQKISALSRITSFMKFSKRGLILTECIFDVSV